MDFDLGWLLWALPVAFAMGWLASRVDLRQLRLENRQDPKAYFRGLNLLLNEQQDAAIDAFIEAVRKDPDTSELHFALGNLFRRRGDYDRAVRVHEHLLQRADLSEHDRQRAQHAVAQDFLKAGLLDRAEISLKALDHTPFETQARLALLTLYERSRDWEQACHMAEQLTQAGLGSFEIRQAHYVCEQAALLLNRQQLGPALAELEALVRRIPASPRAWIMLAQLRELLNQPAGAIEAVDGLLRHAPGHLPLIASSLARWSLSTQQEEQARLMLRSFQRQHPLSLEVSLALAQLCPNREAARQLLLEHLQTESSLVLAARWLQDEPLSSPDAQLPVQQALEKAAAPLKRYRCAACGFEARQYFWQCPGCQTWDSYPPRHVEEL